MTLSNIEKKYIDDQIEKLRDNIKSLIDPTNIESFDGKDENLVYMLLDFRNSIFI